MMRIEDYKGNNLIDYSVDLGEESKGSKIFGSFKEKAGILFQTYNQILKHYNQK
ncbi:MAG: hypothetical protein U9Q99_03150 [Nanoarchaeota archaeon]|nr:hypothetical protein [Nanoarchaeota archaeon]